MNKKKAGWVAVQQTRKTLCCKAEVDMGTVAPKNMNSFYQMMTELEKTGVEVVHYLCGDAFKLVIELTADISHHTRKWCDDVVKVLTHALKTAGLIKEPIVCRISSKVGNI